MPQVEVLDPAIKGTLNVLKACLNAKVKRVVMTSSSSALDSDPNRPTEEVIDESCWSDENFLRENKVTLK
jgi:nucleoside-diphosphate-sugar epimerase